MKDRTLQASSKKQPKRKLSVFTKKKIVQYWQLGLKTEAQLFQQYGINRKLLEEYHRWYYRHFQQASGVSPRILRKMTTKEKIKELERRNRELEKALEWEKIKSLTWETAINIAEEKLGITIKKKSGSKPSDR